MLRTLFMTCLFVGLSATGETYTPERVYRNIESVHIWLKDANPLLRELTPPQLCVALSTVVLPIMRALFETSPSGGPYNVTAVPQTTPFIKESCSHIESIYQNSCINSIGRARSESEYIATILACEPIKTAAQAECVENKAALARFQFSDLDECLRAK